MKAILKVLVLVLAVAATAWMGTLIYWQIRIGRAIRVLEERATYNVRPGCSFESTPEELASCRVQEAGIRSLPALARSIRPTQRPEYLTEATLRFRGLVSEAASLAETSPDWLIPPEAEVSERERKCRLIQEWWRANGHRFPWIWQPWSSRIPGR